MGCPGRTKRYWSALGYEAPRSGGDGGAAPRPRLDARAVQEAGAPGEPLPTPSNPSNLSLRLPVPIQPERPTPPFAESDAKASLRASHILQI